MSLLGQAQRIGTECCAWLGRSRACDPTLEPTLLSCKDQEYVKDVIDTTRQAASCLTVWTAASHATPGAG